MKLVAHKPFQKQKKYLRINSNFLIQLPSLKQCVKLFFLAVKTCCPFVLAVFATASPSWASIQEFFTAIWSLTITHCCEWRRSDGDGNSANTLSRTAAMFRMERLPPSRFAQICEQFLRLFARFGDYASQKITKCAMSHFRNRLE